MSDTSQPQKYCRNCGGQIRPGNAFCAHCGEPKVPSPAHERVRGTRALSKKTLLTSALVAGPVLLLVSIVTVTFTFLDSGGSSSVEEGSREQGGSSTNGTPSSSASTESNVSPEEWETLAPGPANFEVETAYDMSVGGSSLLVLGGSADSLYEEDLHSMAQYVASMSTQYDAVEMDVIRSLESHQNSAEGGLYQGAGMYSGAGISIAHTPDGTFITDIPEGDYLIEPRSQSN